MSRILVIDDEEYIGWIIKKAFEGTDHEVQTCTSALQGIDMVQKQSFELVFLDLRLHDMDGMEVLSKLKELYKELALIIITAHGSIDTAIESMKKGAFDYITKPFDVEELLLIAEKALHMTKLREEVCYLRREASKHIDDISFISKNAKVNSIYSILPKISESSAPILIRGENGTGKEALARKIHDLSKRKDKPFVVFNCSLGNEEFIERELFGYEGDIRLDRGKRNIGNLEIAHKGTMFFDEISALSQSIQLKLLKFIETGEAQRLGGSSEKLDVRIIAATNKNLLQSIEQGEFREDFYYSINLVPLELPPLRERIEDINDFIYYFINKYDTEGKIGEVTPEALKLLKSYHWPGNIRELENVIERIILLNQGPSIKALNLPAEIFEQKKRGRNPIIYFPEEGINLEEVEKELIMKALKMANQNQSRAAQLLGITRSALIYRMQKYGI